MAATVLGGENGPYTIVYPGNGCISTDDSQSAQKYCTSADWTAFQTSLEPTFVGWQAGFDAFVATTPTMAALAAWVGTHPPLPD